MSPQKEISSSDEELEPDDDTKKEPKCKPLKKARFFWQIKGNYHLHNSDKNCGSKKTQPEATPSTSRGAMNSSSVALNGEPSVATAQPPAPSNHQSRRSPTRANTSMFPRSEPSALPPVTCDVSSVSWTACDAFNRNMKRAALAGNGEQSDTIDPLDPDDPEWNIRKWQTIQIAKAFMDNTINSVLDAMGFIPEPESAPDSGPDDVLGQRNFPRVENGSREDNEEDESVENEGILSAIERHGLHRHPLESRAAATTSYGYSIRSSRLSSSAPSIWEPNPESLYRPSFPSNQPSVSTEPVPVAPSGQVLPATKEETDSTASSPPVETHADDTQEDILPSAVCKCASETSSEEAVCECSSHSVLVASQDLHEENGSSDEESQSNSSFSEKPSDSQPEGSEDTAEKESESCKKRLGRGSFSGNIMKKKCPEPADETCKSSSSDQSSTSPVPDSGLVSVSCGSTSPTFGHFEFMDAAVAAAIQKKGLSALACQDL